MTREWLAGERAKITAANRRTEYDAYFDGEVWREVGARTWCVNTPETARPLVVIDPEDSEAAGRLLDLLWDNGGWGEGGTRDELVANFAAALREFADPKPPKCPATLVIGGARLDCERQSGHVTDHRNDSVAQGLRWGA